MVAETLDNISIVEVASMAEVVARIAHHHHTVTLPHLLRLNVVPFHEGINLSHDYLAEDSIAPQVRILSFGMEANEYMGQSRDHLEAKLVKAFGSCREITLAMGYLRRGRSLRFVSKLETVAFHLSPDPMWLDRVDPADQTTSSSVRSCILVQQSSSKVLDANMNAAISSYLSSFFGGSVFPSLERVYYLTEEPNDLIWPL